MTGDQPSATVAAIEIVKRAPTEAAELKSEVIGQEHLLLAIGAAPECLGARALGKVTNNDPGAVRVQLLGLIRPRWDVPSAPAKPTPRVIRALEEAHAEGREQNRPATTADILIGILRSHVGVGFQLLTFSNVTVDALRGAVDELLPSSTEVAETSRVMLYDALTVAAT